MTTWRVLGAGLLLTGGATIAVAQTPVPVIAAPATPPAEAPKPKKSCRRENTTGSIMLTSVCHTASEWAAIDTRNQASAETMRNARGRAGGPGQP